MMVSRMRRAAATAALLLAPACVDTRSHSQGIFILVDTSGTYAGELGQVGGVVGYVLGTLRPGDTVAVANIGSRSFSEREIVAHATLDGRPSRANAQKRALGRRVASFLEEVEPSRYTDITGALIQAAQYLEEAGAARKTILVFSDLQEDLDAETIRDVPIDLTGIEIVAVNVIKLGPDNLDPSRYRRRLARWQERVLDAGASSWRVVNELDRLAILLGEPGGVG